MELATFDSIEDFWGIYNRLLPINKLRVNSNYLFFKVDWFQLSLTGSQEFTLPGRMRQIQMAVAG